MSASFSVEISNVCSAFHSGSLPPPACGGVSNTLLPMVIFANGSALPNIVWPAFSPNPRTPSPQPPELGATGAPGGSACTIPPAAARHAAAGRASAGRGRRPRARARGARARRRRRAARRARPPGGRPAGRAAAPPGGGRARRPAAVPAAAVPRRRPARPAAAGGPRGGGPRGGGAPPAEDPAAADSRRRPARRAGRAGRPARRRPARRRRAAGGGPRRRPARPLLPGAPGGPRGGSLAGRTPRRWTRRHNPTAVPPRRAHWPQKSSRPAPPRSDF